MKTFALSYFTRRAKGKNKNLFTLYARLTIDGKRADFTLSRLIDPSDWDVTRSCPKGRSAAVKELEKYLATMEELFYRLERQLIEREIPITIESLLKSYKGATKGEEKQESQKTLCAIFELHNKQLQELSDSGQIVNRTVTRYKATQKYFVEFLTEKYNKTDIALASLEYSFVKEFDHFVRTKKACAHNTTVKYIKNLKKVIKMAVEYGWLEKDPFAKFKQKSQPVNRSPLDTDELKKIENLKFDTTRLENVRNWVLFSCYTGLAYTDISTLKSEHITRDNDGSYWINKPRNKTKVMSKIYLFPKALAIIDSYRGNPLAERDGTVFPKMSNQRLNAYLKEIGDLAGIKKKLTFHLCRYTFATTVTLGNGVSLESVMSALGHANVRQTQQYAKMVGGRIKAEMEKIKDMF